MATTAVNHRIIPPPLLTPPSISIPLLSAKRQLCLRTSPLITPKNLTYPEKCSFRVTSCISSSSSRRIRFHPSARLYVSGLSYRTTEESLRNAFERFGELLEVTLVMDKVANRPRGIAFLRYATKEEAEKAIERMHGKDSYALCRVFKKNVVCSDVEEQGHSNAITFHDYSKGIVPLEHEAMSPEFPLASSSSAMCMEEEDNNKDDKDDSWMQFINTDDVWCSSSSTTIGGQDVSQMTFPNY